MKVNSISSNQVFGHDSNKLYMSVLRDASDSDLKYLAYAKASYDVNDRKHRRISDLLYYSVPVAAGVAEAVKPASISRIGRLGLGAKGFLSLAIPFALIDATFGIKNFIDKHSSTSAKFTKEHPFVSAMATLGAGIAGILVFNRAAGKLGAKYGEQFVNKLAPEVAKLTKKLDASKVLNYASKQLAKLPSSLKEFSKVALDWSPWMLVFANVGHSINHENVKNAEYMKNYQALKDVQRALDAE